MIASATAIWRNLWGQHDRTKAALNIFRHAAAANRREDSPPGAAANSAGASGTADSGQDHNRDEPEETPRAYKHSQLVGLILGPALFVLTLLFVEPEGLPPEGQVMLAITLWVGTWWVTEALPIPATALLPFFLIPFMGAMDGEEVASAYGDDVVFLFLGGFCIAIAMQKWNLHKRIALFIISVIGTSTQRILLGFMVATGFLSMWVSNTAAVMMMVPMGLAVTEQIGGAFEGKAEGREFPRFEKALLFGIAYAGTIAGTGTLIGTPPNIILAGQMETLFGVEVSFARWMLFATPVSAVLLVLTWLYLGRVKFRTGIKELPGGRELIQRERSSLGKIAYEETMVTVVFCFAAFMWVTREFLWDSEDGIILGIPGLEDGTIAIVAAVLLFAIPGRRNSGSRILEWSDSRDIPWGVLLLFGGGLAIAAGFTETGLSDWLGGQLAGLEGLHIFIIIAATAALIMAMGEITSNTATATMILPVVATLAVEVGIHPFGLMFAAAMASNCTFMLPTGTPPNAIIFGTGKVRIIEMVRAGIAVNIYATTAIILAAYFLLPLVFGIDLASVPSELQ